MIPSCIWNDEYKKMNNSHRAVTQGNEETRFDVSCLADNAPYSAGNIRTSFNYGRITACSLTSRHTVDSIHNFTGKFTRIITEVIGSWRTAAKTGYSDRASKESKCTFCTLTMQHDRYGCPTHLHISMVSNRVNYWPLPVSVQSMLLLEACTTPLERNTEGKEDGGWWLEETIVCGLSLWQWAGSEKCKVCSNHPLTSRVCGFLLRKVRLIIINWSHCISKSFCPKITNV